MRCTPGEAKLPTVKTKSATRERPPGRVIFSRQGFVGFRGGPIFAFAREQLEDQQAHTDDDEAVGEIEIGPGVAAPQLEVEKVDDLAAKNPVDQIADGTPENEP